MQPSDSAQRVVVVMPAFNEAACIAGFLHDLEQALLEWSPSFIVVDDASMDDTSDVIRTLTADGLPATVVRNEVNLGHGASTLRALRLGLSDGADRVLALDGDGQFNTDDIANVVRTSFNGNDDVVEGARTARSSPMYRQVVSGTTRLLVWSSCGVRPADANTPLRAYRPSTLEQLLETVESETSIPNLFISGQSRRLGLRINEIGVRTADRQGADARGTTWRARWSSVPSGRFVTFCWRASNEWVRFAWWPRLRRQVTKHTG